MPSPQGRLGTSARSASMTARRRDERRTEPRPWRRRQKDMYQRRRLPCTDGSGWGPLRRLPWGPCTQGIGAEEEAPRKEGPDHGVLKASEGVHSPDGLYGRGPYPCGPLGLTTGVAVGTGTILGPRREPQKGPSGADGSVPGGGLQRGGAARVRQASYYPCAPGGSWLRLVRQ